MNFKKYLTYSLVVGSLTLTSVTYTGFSDYDIIKNSQVHAAQVGNAQVSNWAKPYVEAMKDGGLLPSSLQTSDLTQNITREEFAELVTTYVNKVGVKGGSNANINFSDSQNPLVKQAAQMGIVAGYPDGTFKPKQHTNREQIATMTYRGKKLVRPNMVVQSNTTLFTDGGTVSNWAKEGVGSMKYDGVIDGYTDKTFRPKNQATRQEAIKIVAELAAKKGFITINHPVTPTNPQPQKPVTSKPADGSIPLNQHGIPQNPKPAPQTIAEFTPDIRVGYHTNTPETNTYFNIEIKNRAELGSRRDINVEIECVSHPVMNKLNRYNNLTDKWNVVDYVSLRSGELSVSKAANLYSMPRITPNVTKDMSGNAVKIKDGEVMEYKITMSKGSEKVEFTQYIQFKDKKFKY